MYFKIITNGKLERIGYSSQEITGDFIIITKEEHDYLEKAIRTEAKTLLIAEEEAMKPAQEYEKKIQDKLREMAIAEIAKDKLK